MSLETSHIVPATREQVWRWHAQPGAVARLTPPFLPMVPKKVADNLADGTTVFSMPAGLRWESRHDLSGFVKGYCFTDVCVASPIKALAQWRHVHTFAEHIPSPAELARLNGETSGDFDAYRDGTNGGSIAAFTKVTDEVQSRLPAATLEPMFAYRQHQLIADFRFATSLHASYGGVPLLDEAGHKPLTIAITGARTNTGRALSAQLGTLGHQVIALIPRTDPTTLATTAHNEDKRAGKAGFFATRPPKALKPNQRWWDPQAPAPLMLADVDVLIHLEGEDFFASPSALAKTRHDNKAAEKIQAQADALITHTRRLATAAAQSPRCRTIIATSAIAAYGPNRGEEVLTEASEKGPGRAAAFIDEWESSFHVAQRGGARVVFLRTGEVLNGSGGVLPVVKTLVSAGLGSSITNTGPWFSWISQDDLTDIFITAIFERAMNGPINAVAPNLVRSTELAKILRTQLRASVRLPIPNLRPRLLPGTGGQQPLALGSTRVTSEALSDIGFAFRYPHLSAALAHELGTETLFDN